MKRTSVLKIERVLKEKNSKEKILYYLFKYPLTEFTLSELAHYSGVQKSQASKIIRDFEKEGLVQIKETDIILRIKSNIEHFNFRKEKIIYNLSIIYGSNLVEYLNAIFNYPMAMILFGSFRRGEDVEGSDIDIAIEIGEERELEVLENIKELEEFEKTINRKIKFYLFNRKKIDSNLFNNIANGIVLSGFLEVKP